MNSDNIGKFIKQLREEKGLTQEELASKVHIGREAVSKWERGKTSPDSSVLLILSEIFNVTINEILIGERKTEKNATLELYQDRNKLIKGFKKTFLVFSIAIICFLILFLSYYFLNQYKSIHAYTINGYGENFDIVDGLFVKTNGKMYFNLGNIINKNNVDYELIELYYKNGKENIVICYTENSSLSFVDYKGYEEYIDVSKINVIINNLYLKIKLKDNEEIIKLELIEDYVNDNFLFIDDADVSLNKEMKINNINSKKIVDLIKDKFNVTENGYEYKFTYKDKNFILNYLSNNDLLSISILKDKKIIEEYYYDLNFSTLSYNAYDDSNYNFSVTLEKDFKCSEKECVIIDNFINILNSI